MSEGAAPWPAGAVPAARDTGRLDGLDAVTGRRTPTGVSEPTLVTGPGPLATLRYRAPEPVVAAKLSAKARLIQPDFGEVAAAAAVTTD